MKKRNNSDVRRVIVKRIRELLMDKNELGVELLYKHFGPDAMNCLQARFSRSLNQIDLDAAINNALFKAWMYGHSIDVDQNLEAWFRRICINEAIDLCHKIAKVLTCDGSQVVDANVEESPICKPPNPLAKCLSTEIENLPNLQKRVVMADMQAGGEENAAVLAVRFDTSANSIRVSRSKARKKLRLRLQIAHNPVPEQSLSS